MPAISAFDMRATPIGIVVRATPHDAKMKISNNSVFAMIVAVKSVEAIRAMANIFAAQ
jgi:hypothetical protein